MKSLIFSIAVVPLLMIGCSGQSNPTDPPPHSAHSGIVGSIEIGPTMPVCRADQSCYRPYQAIVTIFDSRGREITVVESDTTGRFSVHLPPGSYTLVPAQPNQGSFPLASPVTVSVPVGKFTSVEIVYDTGIA